MADITLFAAPVKEDLGTVYLTTNIKQDQFNPSQAVRKSMKDSGKYNTEYCDVCSVQTNWSDEEVEVYFKFVHYSVRTMATEPYWRIVFKEA